jgi:hypothetical protein
LAGFCSDVLKYDKGSAAQNVAEDVDSCVDVSVSHFRPKAEQLFRKYIF